MLQYGWTEGLVVLDVSAMERKTIRRVILTKTEGFILLLDYSSFIRLFLIKMMILIFALKNQS